MQSKSAHLLHHRRLDRRPAGLEPRREAVRARSLVRRHATDDTPNLLLGERGLPRRMIDRWHLQLSKVDRMRTLSRDPQQPTKVGSRQGTYGHGFLHVLHSLHGFLMNTIMVDINVVIEFLWLQIKWQINGPMKLLLQGLSVLLV